MPPTRSSSLAGPGRAWPAAPHFQRWTGITHLCLPRCGPRPDLRRRNVSLPGQPRRWLSALPRASGGRGRCRPCTAGADVVPRGPSGGRNPTASPGYSRLPRTPHDGAAPAPGGAVRPAPDRALSPPVPGGAGSMLRVLVPGTGPRVRFPPIAREGRATSTRFPPAFRRAARETGTRPGRTAPPARVPPPSGPARLPLSAQGRRRLAGFAAWPAVRGTGRDGPGHGLHGKAAGGRPKPAGQVPAQTPPDMTHAGGRGGRNLQPLRNNHTNFDTYVSMAIDILPPAPFSTAPGIHRFFIPDNYPPPASM
jgi:hypothetical protein